MQGLAVQDGDDPEGERREPGDGEPAAEQELAVADRPLAVEALGSPLDQHGRDGVAGATDGADAVRRAGDLQPGLVLLDLSMPGMSGLEALPSLRDAAPECEVVVLTASGTE